MGAVIVDPTTQAIIATAADDRATHALHHAGRQEEYVFLEALSSGANFARTVSVTIFVLQSFSLSLAISCPLLRSSCSDSGYRGSRKGS